MLMECVSVWQPPVNIDVASPKWRGPRSSPCQCVAMSEFKSCFAQAEAVLEVETFLCPSILSRSPVTFKPYRSLTIHSWRTSSISPGISHEYSFYPRVLRAVTGIQNKASETSITQCSGISETALPTVTVYGMSHCQYLTAYEWLNGYSEAKSQRTETSKQIQMIQRNISNLPPPLRHPTMLPTISLP